MYELLVQKASHSITGYKVVRINSIFEVAQQQPRAIKKINSIQISFNLV